LLAAPSDPGEIRRLTIFFADLVDSTVLSTRVEPETYRLLVGRYREQVLRAVHRYEGHSATLRATDFWRSSVTRLPTRTTCDARCTPDWKSPGR
jgi:class 3 adenylate cyclase